MKTFKYIVTNLAFLLFFVFENSIHPFIFNGLFFILFFVTMLAFITMFAGSIIIFVQDDDKVIQEIKSKYTPKPNWYYQIDASYDIIMIFIIAGNSHYAYAIFYALTNLAAFLYRAALKS